MDGEILDVVTEWGTRSVGDGISGLYDLADAAFSGAVTDGTAWAFLLNGRVVGVFDGDVDDFEDAALTAYTAPDVSLPLLYAMQAGGGETRGQYYSNETPLSETDATLSSGNFVGYVELSENVLSGDYYVVYYGGQSLPVAFVGNEPRLLTGDEAFERADEEVGIYSVVDADVTVVDLPDRPGPVDEGSGPAAAATGDDDDDDVDDVDEGPSADDGVLFGGDPTPDDTDPADAAGTGTDKPDVDLEAAMEADSADAAEAPAASDSVTDDAAVAGATPDGTAGDSTDATETDATPGSASDGSADDETGVDSGPDSDTEASSDAPEPTPSTDDVERLRRELDDAREALAEAETERDEYRAEVERLRDRIERLEAPPDTDGEERTLPPAEALSGTNLFVRYEDEAGATVERAAAGHASTADLRTNLRIDYHTEFEAAGTRVDDRPFEAFLRGTLEHRFVEWLLVDLPHDIRRADGRSDVSKLYEVADRIDRIDLDGEVAVDTGSVSDADGEADAGTTVSFDVVCRDKMGDPLFVADVSDSRDPTRAPTIESLLERSTSLAESNASLAAATVVTTSFFEGDAMEVAVDATRGGLFSRSSRRSYVKLSRKHGFHLCLVEARDEEFFLTIPDL